MTYGGFVYGGESIGGDIYGPGDIVTILTTEQLTGNLIKLTLDGTLVVDANYLNPSNYSITVLEGSGPIGVRSILAPKKSLTSTDILIETDHIAEGTTYQIDVDDTVTSTSLRPIAGSGLFTGKRTKMSNMLKGIPKHFNTSPQSTLLHVLLAITQSDEKIGGS